MQSEFVSLIEVEFFKVTIILTKNTHEGRIFKIFSKYVFRNWAVVTMESPITIITLEARTWLQASIAGILFLLYQVFQSSSNIDPPVLFFVIWNVLVILQALLVEVNPLCFIPGVKGLLKCLSKVRGFFNNFWWILKNKGSN